MSSIAGITQDRLLKNKKIRHVKFDGEWYFSMYDLNLQYIGAFKDEKGLVLPLKDSNNEREYINCVPFYKVKEVSESLENVPEFNQAIEVIFGFGKKKK